MPCKRLETHGVIKAGVDRATNSTEVRACQTTTDAPHAEATAGGRRSGDIDHDLPKSC